MNHGVPTGATTTDVSYHAHDSNDTISLTSIHISVISVAQQSQEISEACEKIFHSIVNMKIEEETWCYFGGKRNRYIHSCSIPQEQIRGTNE